MGFVNWAIGTASKAYNWARLCGMGEHRWRVRQARRVPRKLRSMRGVMVEARLFAYLRKVEPLVFEELVLCACEEAGFFVVRNRRYSGDGGIDGRIWTPDLGWCAIQAKRYGAHISHTHVADFSATLTRHGFRRGVFIHTGRTGAAAYGHLVDGRVILVSGQRLIDLLYGACLPHAFGKWL